MRQFNFPVGVVFGIIDNNDNPIEVFSMLGVLVMKDVDGVITTGKLTLSKNIDNGEWRIMHVELPECFQFTTIYNNHYTNYIAKLNKHCTDYEVRAKYHKWHNAAPRHHGVESFTNDFVNRTFEIKKVVQ
jgi:hypothetical protein